MNYFLADKSKNQRAKLTHKTKRYASKNNPKLSYIIGVIRAAPRKPDRNPSCHYNYYYAK